MSLSTRNHHVTRLTVIGCAALLLGGQVVSALSSPDFPDLRNSETHSITVETPQTNLIEAQAWEAWDHNVATYGIDALVSSDGVTPYRVDFEASSPLVLPIVGGTTVIEHDGIYYRFAITYTEPQGAEFTADFGDVAQ